MSKINLINHKDRVINLFGDIEEDICKDTIEKIINTNLSDDEYISNAMLTLNSIGFSTEPENISLPPITINLSTFGGDCFTGWGLCDCIRMSATSVKIVCYGKVMSMGIPILLSAQHKAAHKNTTFMIHDVSSYTWGKAQEIKESLDETIKLRNQYMDYICDNSKFPRKKFEEIIEKKQDFYFTAEEALKWKFIDEIIDDEMLNIKNEEVESNVKSKDKSTKETITTKEEKKGKDKSNKKDKTKKSKTKTKSK